MWNSVSLTLESTHVFGRDQGFAAELPLSALTEGDGSDGFVLDGIDVHDLAGWVGTAGDFNGDEIDDLIIGAPDADPDGRVNAGETYVLFGRNTDQTGNFPALPSPMARSESSSTAGKLPV